MNNAIINIILSDEMNVVFYKENIITKYGVYFLV